jgi:hypothetical protein
MRLPLRQMRRHLHLPHPAGRANVVPVGLILTIGLIMGLRYGGRGTVLTFFICS